MGYAGELLNARLTPGLSNPDVAQDNIQDTICVKAFTKTVRPSANYTNRLKKKQLVEYGYKQANPKAFEQAHLISLGVGGNPTDPHNLWPQSKKGEWSAGAWGTRFRAVTRASMWIRRATDWSFAATSC